MKRIFILLLVLQQAGMQMAISQYFPPEDVTDADTCFFDDFCWSINIDTSQKHNLWQIGVPSKTFMDTAYIGTHAIITDSVHFYDTNSVSSFTIQLEHINTRVHVLVFWHKYDTDEKKDGGYIELSYDMGKTWVNIIDHRQYEIKEQFIALENFYSSEDSLSNMQYGFSGNSEKWKKSVMTWDKFPVDGYTDESVNRDTTLLRFTYISDSVQDNKEGWCIDNIIHLKYENYNVLPGTKKNKNIVIAPNPSKDYFSYASPVSPDEIIIYNQLGTTVRILHNPGHTLLIHDLKPGIYFVAFYSGKQLLSVSKLLKTE